MSPISKKLYTTVLLLILTAQIASAALSLEPEPILQPIPLPPSEEEGILPPVKIDSSKIYQPDPSKLSSNLPKSAKLKLIEVRKSPKNALDQKSATTIANPISAGLVYLLESQSADGSWSQGDKLKFQTTATVTELLNSLNQKVGASSTDQQVIDTILPKALDSLRFSFPENNDYLAQKTAALSEAGDDMTDSMDYLVGQINDSELAFGLKKNFSGDIITTAKILEAIAANDYEDPGPDPQFTLKVGLLYLLNSQNSDYGWPEIKGESSSKYASSLVLRVLYPYRNAIIEGLPNGDIVIPTRINLALNNYLSGYKNFAFLWQDNLLYSSLIYDNFSAYGIQPTPNQQAIDYLKNQQNADGSFGNPVNLFYTAKALQALAKPDMTVTSIANISGYTPNASATLEIVVKNQGYVTSDPVSFAATPHAFSLYVDNIPVILDFTGQPDFLIFEPDDEAIFQITFNEPAFGEHQVKFKVDYPFAEFWKSNNELTDKVPFDSPEFSGPHPPAWLGASTASTPGYINLRWQVSTDSRTNAYAVFISTVSDIYDHNNPAYISPPGSGNQIGVSFIIDPSLYDVPLYFSIAAVDSAGLRGNYANESWAVAYSNPENYRGTLTGRVYNENTGQGVPGVEVSLWTYGTWLANPTTGNYTLNYYPGFYLVSLSATGFYQQDPAKVQITTQSYSAKDLPMKPQSTYSPPPPVTGLIASPSDSQVTLYWNPYTSPTDFKQFNIHRANGSFGSVTRENIIASSTNPSLTSFIDTRVVNGLNYFYAVSAEDLEGELSIQSSIGPVQPGSVATVSSVSASQSGPDVLITYNLVDSDGNPSNISFEFWDGSVWQEIMSATGEGTQTSGPNKTGTWHAKQDLPGFDGQIKIKVKAIQGSGESFGESALFNLDTQNPSSPTLSSYRPTTALFNKAFGGSKETGTLIEVNGVATGPVTTNTSWSYETNLQTGLNQLNFTAVDNLENESAPVSANITYDPNYFVCGDMNGDEIINILDVTLVIEVAFRDGIPPTPFARGDINGDGKYDIFDVVLLINHAFRNAPEPTGCYGN